MPTLLNATIARHGGHLAAVDGGHAERFVVGLEGADALGFQQVADIAHDVEETGHGRTGIAGQQMDTALGFEGAFDEQFITGEDFPAGYRPESADR